jgi:glycerol-3-phosphate acyltransferase PlsY
MFILALLLSFFIGAIPFGVLIGRMRGVDVRASGSGNIGATNVWRVLGPKAGTAAFVLDVLKGVAGPLIARWLVPGDTVMPAVCGAFSVLGHNFSPFIGFKGGKGISTSLGALFGLMPWVALIDFALWGVVLAVSRRVSVASMTVCITLPLLALFWREPTPNLIVAFLLGIMVFIKHIPNLKRIIAGTEPKIGQKKVESPVEVA